MSRSPEVQFLWWRECPSWERALELLRSELEAAGLDPSAVALTEIDGDEDAERLGFPGSPTILIDGSDVQPPDAEAPRGLTCRVYRRPDGRVSPLPDREQLREAIQKAKNG
jgi:hypothetical protein